MQNKYFYREDFGNIIFEKSMRSDKIEERQIPYYPVGPNAAGTETTEAVEI